MFIALLFALQILFPNIGTFVIKFFPLCKRHFHFDLAPFVKIHAHGNKRLPPFPDLPVEFFYLLSVKEQLSFAARGMVETVGMIIRTDVRVHQKNFSMLDNRMAVSQIDRPSPASFYLAPVQYNARFKRFNDMIIVSSLFVLADEGSGCGHAFSRLCAHCMDASTTDGLKKKKGFALAQILFSFRPHAVTFRADAATDHQQGALNRHTASCVDDVFAVGCRESECRFHLWRLRLLPGT